MTRSLFAIFGLVLFVGTAPSHAQEQCSDLLMESPETAESIQYSPKEILLDLASRLDILAGQLSRSTYINTHRLRYMKAMVLETTVLNQYYGDLYSHLFPDQPQIAQGFRERQGFLEALNVHISSIAKYRDLEIWLIASQSEAMSERNSAKVQAYQVLRDELNLIYYKLLAQLHDELLGKRAFHFDEPTSWKSWFGSYVAFIENLPEVALTDERNFLRDSLARDFRALHGQMGAVETQDIHRLDIKGVETRVHDLRRQIRSVNIVLLKNSHLINLKETEHDWLELDSSVVEGAMASVSDRSRYIKLNPTATDRPVLFPELSFYAIYFFTGELGGIKDQLERTLFLEEVKASLKDKPSSPAIDQALNLIPKLSATGLSRKSKDFLTIIKESHLFLYTSSWLREFNLEF